MAVIEKLKLFWRYLWGHAWRCRECRKLCDCCLIHADLSVTCCECVMAKR